ncbi:MAG: hypothetical protein M3116_02570 [Actinomycetota bacterium]|nr:hypothetical protein [Actinomycetota bacterium]
MSSSPDPGLGPTAGPQPDTAEPIEVFPTRRSPVAGIIALALAVLPILILMFGPPVSALLGLRLSGPDMLSLLVVVTLALMVVALVLGIVALITKRGWGFGLAAVVVSGAILLWGLGTFFLPLLFMARP